MSGKRAVEAAAALLRAFGRLCRVVVFPVLVRTAFVDEEFAALLAAGPSVDLEPRRGGVRLAPHTAGGSGNNEVRYSWSVAQRHALRPCASCAHGDLRLLKSLPASLLRATPAGPASWP